VKNYFGAEINEINNMILTLSIGGRNYEVDTSSGQNISIPLYAGLAGPRCYYAPPIRFEAVIAGEFIGDLEAGGHVNYKNITLNPHGNGTHTECVGHIHPGPYTINDCLKESSFLAMLLTVTPVVSSSGDLTITEYLLVKAWKNLLHQLTPETSTIPNSATALIVRTSPNGPEKKLKDYSGTNPPYFTPEAIEWSNRQGFQHLLTDLPSVDKEEDEGTLLAHKRFWGLPEMVLSHKTITELIYVDDLLKDNVYFCQIQTIPLQLDASPSKVLLYSVKHVM